MNNKIKIVVAGIGGVGGYFGGLLAKHYENSPDVEIIFLARGQHLRQIKLNGLTIISGNTRFVARPYLATDDTSVIGKAHFIIICTKSYDLEDTLEQVKPCMDSHTVLLPLLNGVDSNERIKRIFPTTIVFEGCVYIISRIKEAGVIENSGNIQSLYFGGERSQQDKLVLLHKLLKEAYVEVSLSKNIASTIWEKFIFISPTATATSYFDCPIGQLLDTHRDVVEQLIQEVLTIAVARQISMDTDIATKTMDKLRALPYVATSSMHSDFMAGKQKTELLSLTGYIVQEGKRLTIKTPMYSKMYRQLQAKSGS